MGPRAADAAWIVLHEPAVRCHVLVEEPEPGVWIVRTATVIPDNERWLHEPVATEDLQAAMAWSASHPPADADLDATLTRLSRDEARRPHQVGSEQSGVSGLDTLNKISQLSWNRCRLLSVDQPYKQGNGASRG